MQQLKKGLFAGALLIGISGAGASADVIDTVFGSGTGATVDGSVAGGEYAATVSGGGGGFGGPVGGATLSLDTSATGIHFALSGLGDYSGNSIRIYFDTRDGGFSDISSTGGFNDNGDFGREQLSRPARDGVTLPFAADYGWVISPAFGGFQALFELATGGAHSLIFAGNGVNTSPVGEFPTASTFEAFIPFADLGISAGDTVDFVLLYANNGGFGDAFLSDESFPFQFGSNPGHGPATVDDFHRFITTVPEPGSMALLGLGGLALLRRRRA